MVCFKRHVLGALVVLLGATAAIGQATAPKISADLFEAPAIEARALNALIARERPRVLLFDTRTADEFVVSHIHGAVRIEPGPGAVSDITRYADRARGADVVFYCTIGPRSAGVAIEAMDGLIAAGAAHVHVLKDGLIAWANEGLPLVDDAGPTDFVHPFDARLVSALRRPEMARLQPGQ